MLQTGSPLILYASPDSANLVVRFVIEELGLGYEEARVDRSTNAQRSADYLKLNPQGLIPVLIDPDQDMPLFETGAILLHLAEKTGKLGPRPDDPERGRLLKWLFFISNTLHADLRLAFYPQKYLQNLTAAEELRAGVSKRLTAHFNLIEAELQRHGGPFLLGGNPTVADFYLAGCARWSQLYPAALPTALPDCPLLIEMLTILQSRPSVMKACALESIPGGAFVDPQMPDVDEAAILGA